MGQPTVGSNPTSSAVRAAAGRWEPHLPPAHSSAAAYGRGGTRGHGPLDDYDAMRLALDEAAAAVTHGDIPVGAVALVGGRVVACRHNERERTGDPSAHAEVLALRDAAADRAVATRGLTLVVTLEPCAMCAGALVAARAGRLVFGAADPKAGACGTLYQLCADPRLNHELPVTAGVMASGCADILREFFATRR